MTLLLSDRARALGGSQTSGMRNRARRLRAQGIRVVNFAAGELDQDTSPSIREAARVAAGTGPVQYTDTLGIAPLRQRLAERVTRKTGAPYTVDEVGFTAGAKQALFNAVFTAFGPGDEVIIPAPYWVTFPEQVRLAGATPVFLPTVGDGFQIDTAAMANLVTPRTRGMILNTPHNPTGAVYPASALQQIAALVLQHDLTCIFDECYDELTYAPALHHNIVKLVPAVKEQTILVGSLSKTYCMAGWRAGYVAGPVSAIKAISNLQSHIASNPSNIVQYAALAALDAENDPFVAGVRESLRQQRTLALGHVQRLPGVRCGTPEGAFYLFPDISLLLDRSFQGQRIGTVDQLAELALEHAHVAVVPGSAFGSERHVRISYSIAPADISEGFANLEHFIHSLT